ncbi:MAG: hypothetical protein FWD92_06145 [Methanomassiliicoccaceae archaeon]|nr:hypothetical protein [Methanomassiliicoccaceae archaeon]
MGKLYAALCAGFFSVSSILMFSPNASASGSAASGGPTLSDLLGKWVSALFDPATYMTWTHLGSFFDFLKNETFLSVFSSSYYSSLNRDSILGSIPNIFFLVCIISIILSISVAIIEVRKLERKKRVVRK